MARPAEKDAVSSLSRGLALLELFSMDESELSISEMARRARIPKSTTHRLVTDLLKWGALERGGRGVRLGVRLFELGSLVSDPARLRERAIPFAHSLNQITQLTSNLAVREGNEIIYLEKINARDLAVPHSRIGGRLPLHCTALGKAILANAPTSFINRVLSEPLARLSPKTITDPEQLRRQLPEIRATGVAYDIEESQPGLFCVGAPIFARNGQVLGALSVTGAVSLDQARRFSGVTRATADALSHALGTPTARSSTRYAGRRVAHVMDVP